MIPCKKCGGEKTGTQAYCISCWRVYAKEHMAKYRAARKAKKDGGKRRIELLWALEHYPNHESAPAWRKELESL
jgi:hypothetical protein